MIIDREKKLVVLANTKVASTSIEAALFKIDSTERTRGGPAFKHISYQNYLSMQQGFGTQGFKTMCVIRNPFDKMISWYKFRCRDSIASSERSLADISFETLVQNFIDGDRTRIPEIEVFDRLFVTDTITGMRVDRLYRYEELEALWRDLSAIYGHELEVPRLNISPAHPENDRFEQYRERFETAFADEVRWYENVKTGEVWSPTTKIKFLRFLHAPRSIANFGRPI